MCTLNQRYIIYFFIVFTISGFLPKSGTIGYCSEEFSDESVYKTVKVTSIINRIDQPKLVWQRNDRFLMEFKITDVEEVSKKSIINPYNPQGISNTIKSKQKSVYNIRDFDGPDQNNMFDIVAHLLEKGEFILVDKKNNKTIRSIIIKYYEENSGGVGGSVGRMFLLQDGTEFYHRIDMW